MLEHSGDNMTRRHGGAGVGLTLAKLAAEKQGGGLSISSEAGAGTKVTVAFPSSRLQWPDRGPDGPNPPNTVAMATTSEP